MTERMHRVEPRASYPLPQGLALTDDLLRIAVIAGDLVNTYNPLTGTDLLRDAEVLAYVVSDHPWPLPPALADDLAPALRLRERLDRVFRRGEYDELDRLLLEHPPALILVPADDGTQRLHVGTAEGALAATLTAQMALALSVFIAEPSAGSFEVCAGPDCTNVAVRRGASVATCSDHCRRALEAVPPRAGRPPGSRAAPRPGRTSRRS
jgi:hypothetical protein